MARPRGLPAAPQTIKKKQKIIIKKMIKNIVVNLEYIYMRNQKKLYIYKKWDEKKTE